MQRSVALILAGGVGSRMNLSVPKQFVEIDGHSVLQYTMMAFQQHQLVSAIYVVASPQWEQVVRQQAQNAGIRKFAGCFHAGDNSFLSARNGIMGLKDAKETADTVVLIHDAVRPLISQDIISRNIAVCLSRGNAITALPSQESFLVVHKQDTPPHEMVSSEYIPREQLLRAQTPHTFFLRELLEMMDEAQARGLLYSQSVFTLANELGHVPLHMADGEQTNFKLTLPSDFTLLRAILHETEE